MLLCVVARVETNPIPISNWSNMVCFVRWPTSTVADRCHADFPFRFLMFSIPNSVFSFLTPCFSPRPVPHALVNEDE